MDLDKKIKLAMAVSNTGNFQAKHFGDADKFEIYEWDNNNFIYLNEIFLSKPWMKNRNTVLREKERQL